MNKIAAYDEAFRFLLEFTDYEKVTKYKYDIATFDLGRVVELMEAIRSPHRAFRSVHIAGTKGKGSTAAMVQSVLTAAGYRTGLYTSPHLSRLEERMTIDGVQMQERDLIEIVNEIVPYTRRMRGEAPNLSPTFFELVTAVGFRHFARQQVDFGAIEVGMGGRLDATNVITPEVSVITRIDFDHVERLGKTLPKIAAEKAGIVKPGVPVVCASQDPQALGVIAATARLREAPLRIVGRDYTVENVSTSVEGNDTGTRFDLTGPNGKYEGLCLCLLGEHQAQNGAAAVAAIHTLVERCDISVSEDALRKGLASARLGARSEFVPGCPPVILDGAHNPISIRALCRTLDNVFAGRRPVMVLGFSRDKDISGMLQDLLPRAGRAILTQSDSPRAEAPDALAEMAATIASTPTEIVATPAEALARARSMAGPDGLVVIAGSFFLAGNLRPVVVENGRL